MTQNTRQYLEGYQDILLNEHWKYVRLFVLHLAVTAVALSLMLATWWEGSTVFASLFGAVFGYFMATLSRVQSKVREIEDELSDVKKRLDDGDC